MSVRHYNAKYNPYRVVDEDVVLNLDQIRTGLQDFLVHSPIADLVPGATGIIDSENPSIYALNMFGTDVCDALNEDVMLDLYVFLDALSLKLSAGELTIPDSISAETDVTLSDAIENTVFIQASGMGNDRSLAYAVNDLVDDLVALQNFMNQTEEIMVDA